MATVRYTLPESIVSSSYRTGRKYGPIILTSAQVGAALLIRANEGRHADDLTSIDSVSIKPTSATAAFLGFEKVGQ